LKAVSVDGAIHFHCMDWRHIGEVREAGEEVYDALKNLLVWVKDNAGMGTFYRSQHELIFAYKVGTAAHTNTFELGQSGRYRSNVLHYPGVNKFKTGAGDELGMHPTVKPVAMVADLIRDVSRRGEIVVDAFGGSGTTLIAAQKTKRRARLIELDPIYVDVICRRFEAFTGQAAVHAETGQTFHEVAAERLCSVEEAA
jgi:DNA modification methylase